MNIVSQLGIDTVEARSEGYRRFAEAFQYPGGAVSTAGGSGPSGSDYLAVFDTALSKEACSLREATYASEDHSALFEELVRFYAYFGLRRTEDAEMPDHVSVELEFMHFLTYLEHRAGPQEDEVESLRRAQRDFLSRHLHRLMQGIRGGLRNRDGYYSGLVETCAEFVACELTSLEDLVGKVGAGANFVHDGIDAYSPTA